MGGGGAGGGGEGGGGVGEGADAAVRRAGRGREAEVRAERRRRRRGRRAGGGGGRRRRRHGHVPRHARGEVVDVRLDGRELIHRAALLERLGELVRRLLSARRIGHDTRLGGVAVTLHQARGLRARVL